MAIYDATTKDNKCIFCEIVSGNIKTAGKFWESDEFMAFLSIDPNDQKVSAILAQMKLVSVKRLKRKLYEIPNELFDEMKQVEATVKPDEIIFVMDSSIG